MRYAESTSVSPEKSRAEIEQVLTRYGCSRFGYMIDARSAVIAFFANQRQVRFVLPLPDPRDRRFFESRGRGGCVVKRTEQAARRQWEQACRQVWRALLLAIKAKLEAVAAGISSFEQEFLAHIVLPNGQTTGEWMLPQIEEAYRSDGMRMPSRLMLEAPSE